MSANLEYSYAQLSPANQQEALVLLTDQMYTAMEQLAGIVATRACLMNVIQAEGAKVIQ